MLGFATNIPSHLQTLTVLHVSHAPAVTDSFQIHVHVPELLENLRGSPIVSPKDILVHRL